MTAATPLETNAVPKLTADELAGLGSRHNLADAHTHQSPTAAEVEGIVDRLPEIFWESVRGSQSFIDEQAATAFLKLNGQDSAVPLDWYLPVYSSSVAMEIIANAMRLRGRTAAMLTEPTFDNIADILRRQDVNLVPVRLASTRTYREAINTALKREHADTLVLVLPNNPTGHYLTKHDLAEVAEACAQRSMSLILDTSFRLHDPRMTFDHYEVLKSSGVDFVVIEDTGKIWPTTDLKLAYLLASDSWRPLLEQIQQDVLLNVSKFISCLVWHFCELSEQDQLESVRSVLQINRRTLRSAISQGLLPFEVVHPESAVSVEFVRIIDGRSATEVVNHLRAHGIAVLSGEAFYWSHPAEGSIYIRIALARDPSSFTAAIEALLDAFRLEAR